MAGTALSSLRVTSDMDMSGYLRGAQQKVAADNQMIASDRARNASLAQVDAAVAKIVPGMSSLSKSLLDGYSAGQQFTSMITRIGNAVDRGMGLDRANALLEANYRKFGLTADAVSLAERGFVSIVPAVEALNQKFAVLSDIQNRVVASQQALSKAQQAQSGINAQFGIGSPGKSAQDSAEAFTAQFGGLEGIARAKAAEAGAAFGADLDASLITGVRKSARDSASVFDSEFRQLDALAAARAAQAGQNFQTSLTQALGGGGPSATSQGATYSALTEMVMQLDAAEQARAAHNQAQFQSNLNLAMGIDNVSKSARDSASAFQEALDAQDKDARSAAALRTAINPLEAEMVRLGKEMVNYRQLVAAGVISSDEFSSAQVLAGKRLTDFQQNLKNGANAGRVMSGELTNLGYQLNDVITGVLLGQSPFMIFAQQGGQIIQIFQNSKASIVDFVTSAGSKLLSFLTIGRLVFGGITTFILGAIAATNSYVNSQNSVRMGLLGSGRASGATQDSINSIAVAGSSASGLSTSEARTFATTLASTGKIANDNLLPIVQMGKDISRVFGTDASDAAKMLADAFGDPARGADVLNQRLGFLDAATKESISNLVAQNNLYQAQIVLMRGVQSGLADVSDATSGTTKFWTAFGNSISNAWDGLGGFLASLTGLGQSTETQLERAKQKLESLKSTTTDYSSGFAITTTGSPEDIARAQEAVDRLTASLEKLRKAQDEAKVSQQSFVNQAAVRSALPIIDQIKSMNNQLITLQKLGEEGFADEAKLKKAGTNLDEVTRAMLAMGIAIKALPQQELVNMLGVAASPAERLAVQIDQIQKKAAELGKVGSSDEQRAIGGARLETAAGMQSARVSALGQSASVLDLVKQKELELARAQLAGANLTPLQISQQKDLARATANGTLQLKAQTDQTNIQAATIGMSTGAAAEYTARMNLLAEAARNHKVLTADDIAAINAQAKALGEAAQAAALMQIQNDIAFGRKTSLLSPEDVQIAQQLKGAYPDVATALSSVEAAGLRTNQALSGISSSLSNDLANGLTDISTGAKSIRQGFSDMTSSIIRDIESMIIKITVVQPLMRALQTGFSSMFNPVAGITGSANGNAFTGSGMTAFANGGMFTNKLFNSPTLFKFANGGGMSLGVMGEAGPEAVMPLRRGPNGRLGVEMHGNDNSAGYGTGGVVVNLFNAPAGTSAQATTSKNSKGQLQLDVLFRDSVRGVINDDLANNTGVAQSFKGFAKSSAYK